MVSVITPAFAESENLVLLHGRLSSIMERERVEWEWIIIDDHSSDATPSTIESLAARDRRVRGIRFARHEGSNTAIVCGLDEATGDCAVLLAADLRDPPDALPDMLRKWGAGAEIVWGVCRDAAAAGRTDWFSRAYTRIMRRVVGLQDSAAAASFFLVDRRVVDAVRHYRGGRVGVFALLGWLGFRQDVVECDAPSDPRKPAALSFAEKIDILSGSLTAFSDLPLRIGVGAGVLVFTAGLACTLLALLGISIGPLSPGWILLLASILIVGGLNLFLLGVVGQYLWRAVEWSRDRPRYVVERRLGRSDKSVRMSGLPEQLSQHSPISE